MTHDELLDKLQNLEASLVFPKDLAVMTVLRAVVELHKPDKLSPDYCQECWRDSNGAEEYPCPTIQAIEGQLK